MERIVNSELDNILGHKFPALDGGYVVAVDYMGGDQSVVNAARISYGSGTKRVSEDRHLIRYLMRHEHNTPFEMPEITFHVRVPMDTWRQWIRHRTSSVNEYSTRYSVAINDKQTTLPGEWRFQAADNKQGSDGFLPIELGEKLTSKEALLQSFADEVYNERLSLGVAREQARKDLPLSTYTEAFWKVDLRNLLHFLNLRMDSHAQKEIRDYAKIIGYEIVAKWCPVVWEAFVDYILESVKLTKHEVNVLRALLSSGVEIGNWDVARLYLESNKLLNYDVDGNKKRNRELDEINEKLIKIGLPPGLKF